MAKIQGNTPDSLEHLQKMFGDRINLTILDVTKGRESENAKLFTGWQHLNVIRSEGNELEIKQKLEKHLLTQWEKGVITNECFEQAAGGRQNAVEISANTNREFLTKSTSRPGQNEQGRAISSASGSLDNNTAR
jgi:hypothetical protein